ncbi:unnamed protein product [Strongylus vulgaris]|uniref:Uncharacterized protein n=1 Tax=Strongylus vulgaris TaxID=40348 RepID=A0A3P7K913_STRVU|nr:unnamed protein product [Strongylus vulgaris]
MRFMTIWTLVTVIPAAIAERVLASHYISDYEKINRPWISYLVNGSSLVLGAGYYLIFQSFFTGLYGMILTVVFTVTIFLLSSLAIMMVCRRDAAKLHDLKNETGCSTLNYTLSMKFQLEENVRVSKVYNISKFYQVAQMLV